MISIWAVILFPYILLGERYINENNVKGLVSGQDESNLFRTSAHKTRSVILSCGFFIIWILVTVWPLCALLHKERTQNACLHWTGSNGSFCAPILYHEKLLCIVNATFSENNQTVPLFWLANWNELTADFGFVSYFNFIYEFIGYETFVSTRFLSVSAKGKNLKLNFK